MNKRKKDASPAPAEGRGNAVKGGRRSSKRLAEVIANTAAAAAVAGESMGATTAPTAVVAADAVTPDVISVTSTVEHTVESVEEPVVNSASQPPAQSAPTSLTLAAECLVTDATSLKASLTSLLDQPQTVTLNVSSLQRIDTAALQVITAFIRERADHGRPVEWQGTAPVLATAAQLLGLTTLLKLPA